MGTIDLSRDAFDIRKRYTGVHLQLGRVILEDDVNDAERIAGEDERLALLDIIGPSGSPDQGFAVENGRINSRGDMTFDIRPGTLYLGGLRLLNPETADFARQPDWLQQPDSERTPPADGRIDCVYLEAWPEPVTAVEDSELFEAALSGPDTSARIRNMWRVRLAPGVTETECTSAWAALVASWQASDLGTMAPSGERVVDARLTVGFVPGTPGDLCSPSVASGYLGAENQAIRVQLVGPRHFTWGFDNAAPLYRVKMAADLSTITFETEPKDQAHWPVANQIVEVLPWSAVLTNGEKLAETSGHLSRVQASYDPDARTITLTTPIPSGPPVFGDEWKDREDAAALAPSSADEFYFLRVWNRGDDRTSDPAIPFTPGTAVPLGTTGLAVTFDGSDFVPGDHWIVAARPETPDQVVPWDFEVGRGVHGIRRFYAPLAVIQWHNTAAGLSFDLLSDCRHPFPPLTRLRTCCTFTVGDGVASFGMYSRIQDAVDHLPQSGGKVCVLPGVYREQVTIADRANVTIEGCGKRSRIVVPEGPESYGVLIVGSQDITIRSLAIEAGENVGIGIADALGPAPAVIPPDALPLLSRAVMIDDKVPDDDRTLRIVLEDLHLVALSRPAVASVGGRHLALRRSSALVGPLPAPLGPGAAGRWPAVFVMSDDVILEGNQILAAADPVDMTGVATGLSPTFTRTAMGGIQLAGGCERVEVRRNVVSGGTGNGITLGSWAWVPVRILGGNNSHLAILSVSRFAPAGFGLVINDDGCIEVDWDPTPPPDDAGTPQVPVSMGALADIRIVDNTITNMGLSGIGVARYFNLAGVDELITVDRLWIEENRIRHCRRLPIPPLPASMRDVAAAGAITLADGEIVVIRDNVIEANGRSHVDPVCGIFTLRATGLSVERNRIVDNAPRALSEEPARPGWRGGIVAVVCRPPVSEVDLKLLGARRGNGVPALRVVDNVVAVPEGRCLVAGGDGHWDVHGNQLTSRGAGTATRGFASGAANGSSSAVAALDSVGGCTVLLTNQGVTHELGKQLVRYQEMSNVEVKPGKGLDPGRAILTGGKILFHDNQVLLDLLSPRTEAVASSVYVACKGDDASIVGNQMTVEQRGDRVSTNLYCLAWSARVNDNRFDETLMMDDRLVTHGLSAFAYATLGTMTSNQASHCLVLVSSLRVFADNIQLIESVGNKPCQGSGRGGILVGIKYMGLTTRNG